MGDQTPFLPQGPGSFPVPIEAHPLSSTTRSDARDYWDPCHPNSLWWQCLPHVNSQEAPSIISDAANPHSVWPQSGEGPVARSPSPQGQVLEQPYPSSLAFAAGDFDESFRNRAGVIPNHNTHAGYNQYITIQKEWVQLTSHQPSGGNVPGGNIQPCRSSNANSYSSDVHPSQVPRQQREEPKEARQYPDAGSARDSENHGQAPREVHPCTKFNCGKVYRRAQDLKRHTRDKHERKRICPFCNARWSRPERIRAHLMKRHETRLTKDHQQSIHFLQGREDTIRFLEKYRNVTPAGTYSPD